MPTALGEIRRILKPGGRLVSVEQVYSVQGFTRLLTMSGFRHKETKILRRGHFPLIYMIRYGAVPFVFFSYIGRIEAFIGKIFKEVCFDYADTMFVMEKPSD